MSMIRNSEKTQLNPRVGLGVFATNYIIAELQNLDLCLPS
jgi:hypothetical protein